MWLIQIKYFPIYNYFPSAAVLKVFHPNYSSFFILTWKNIISSVFGKKSVNIW